MQYIFVAPITTTHSTTEISVDGTHEEGNGNGNANARRPGSGKYLGKGTHASPGERDARELSALKHYLILLTAWPDDNDGDDDGGGDGIGNLLLKRRRTMKFPT